jgi:hypothetical protein
MESSGGILLGGVCDKDAAAGQTHYCHGLQYHCCHSCLRQAAGKVHCMSLADLTPDGRHLNRILLQFLAIAQHGLHGDALPHHMVDSR